MRAIGILFWTANASLVAAGAGFAWTRLSAGRDRQTRVPSSALPVSVVSFAPRETSPWNSLADSESRRGWITFALPDELTVVGVSVARAFAVRNDAPALGKGVDLTATQVRGQVDAKPWLRQPDVPSEVFLAYGLIVRDRGGREQYRQGWARIDVTALRIHGVKVEAPIRGSVELEVKTQEGQAVPGALIVVDPTEVSQSGLASQFLLTAADGTAVLTGLERESQYRATLANGIGPDKRSDTTIVAGNGERQVLRTPLSGRWDFVEHHLHFATSGSSSRVTELTSIDPGSLGAWVVERWIPPGRGLDAPLWGMFPSTTTCRPTPVRVAFSKREAVDLDDFRDRADLAFSLYDQRVQVVHGPKCSTEPPSSR